jgi:hypothetical protein
MSYYSLHQQAKFFKEIRAEKEQRMKLRMSRERFDESPVHQVQYLINKEPSVIAGGFSRTGKK